MPPLHLPESRIEANASCSCEGSEEKVATSHGSASASRAKPMPKRSGQRAESRRQWIAERRA